MAWILIISTITLDRIVVETFGNYPRSTCDRFVHPGTTFKQPDGRPIVWSISSYVPKSRCVANVSPRSHLDLSASSYRAGCVSNHVGDLVLASCSCSPARRRGSRFFFRGFFKGGSGGFWLVPPLVFLVWFGPAFAGTSVALDGKFTATFFNLRQDFLLSRAAAFGVA